MLRIIITVIALFAIKDYCEAQTQQVPGKFRFSSINTAGIGSGANGESVVIQTVNGLSVKKWFAGVGTGIDYYKYRSVLLFADVRYDLSDKKNALFLYADGGVNIPWITNAQKEISNAQSFKSGQTYEGGIGWKLKGKSNRAFLLSAGYNFKQVKREITVFNWWEISPAPNKEYYDERYKRVVIKIGVQL